MQFLFRFFRVTLQNKSDFCRRHLSLVQKNFSILRISFPFFPSSSFSFLATFVPFNKHIVLIIFKSFLFLPLLPIPISPKKTTTMVFETSKATSYLKDYPKKDGLSVKELIDSTNFGGLTYNDFLILPGLINFPSSAVSLETKLTKKSL